VLREYRSALDRHGVDRVRMTATSAARDAENRDDFFAAATEAVGVTPELLGGDEEARLSFLGATAELDPADGPFLVADIGGGSTEFAVGTSSPPDGVLSTDMGCVRLTEKFLHSDPPAPEELSQAFDVVRSHLDDVSRVIPTAVEARRFVGLAGTVSAMASVELGLATYDRDRVHHFVLTRAAAEDVFRTLATERRSQRIHNPGLEEARADVIVGGAVILVAILRYFELPDCLVSESDILDGLVISLRNNGR
jgi:exopolyphosphatase/guanosine-5'-triphosphate,3'-diphosphate pyrophosphatase